ncbi:PAS domain S-box protein [Kiritimatiellota bacterium B12222]|nr:PAS domain S-box protein [Kiritimatiellota bacterium B12222]
MDLNDLFSGDDDLLSNLLSVTTECFVLLDRSGRVREANASFFRLLDVPKEELVGKALLDLMAFEDQISFTEMWVSLLQSHRETGEWRIMNARGTFILMEMNFFQHEKEGVPYICLFCRKIILDSDEQKLNRLRNHALAVTANAMVITDAKGLIVWVNQAFTKYTGYTLEEAEGETPGYLLNSGRQPDSFFQEMWETISLGRIWQGELINRRKDGTLYPEEMTITPMKNENGIISHYIAVKQDISEKKNLQELFLRAQRLESVGTLASGVAHDLNNVLAPIVMSADLLMVTVTDPQQLEMLAVVKESAKRGANIVRQLLTFIRGGVENKVEIQLRHLLKDIIKVYRETFPKYISIDDQISSDLLPVYGDATRLYQVVANLMINARDAMPEGGCLRVHVENSSIDEAEALEIRGAIPGQFVRVRIQDEGCGIPEEIREEIFDSFFTTKDTGKGTGLGLPTSLEIIKNHKGFLTLASEVDKGSTFDVYLPVFRGALQEETQNLPVTIPQGFQERILVIDDEVAIGYLLDGTLSSLNYQVTVTSGGKEGLAWWRENREACDLILLDMMMPEMDGLEVTQTLQREGCKVPIILMSGMVSEEKLRQTGVDLERAFISKPFTIFDLVTMMRSQLDSLPGDV